MSLNKENIVCACASTTVGDVLKYKEENHDFHSMTFDDKLEALDIAQSCGQCEDIECDIIDTHYSEIIK